MGEDMCHGGVAPG